VPKANFKTAPSINVIDFSMCPKPTSRQHHPSMSSIYRQCFSRSSSRYSTLIANTNPHEIPIDLRSTPQSPGASTPRHSPSQIGEPGSFLFYLTQSPLLRHWKKFRSSRLLHFKVGNLFTSGSMARYLFGGPFPVRPWPWASTRTFDFGRWWT
jgi:hypothetical protein